MTTPARAQGAANILGRLTRHLATSKPEEAEVDGKLESVISQPRVSRWLDGPPMRCPRCCSTNLHHGVVTVFSRGEDAAVVTVTRVDRDMIRGLQPSESSRNPSCRRDGAVISFECEQCGPGLEWTLAQHKGESIVTGAFRKRTGFECRRAAGMSPRTLKETVDDQLKD